MEKISVTVPGAGNMDCFVFRPESTPRAGLMVLQEAFGVNAHIKDVAGRFAKEGYLVIAPELFHRTCPGFESEYVEMKGVGEQMDALTDEGLLADVSAAFLWLKEQGIAEDHIGAIGYCMGGRTAFLANTELPLGVAISYYGGRIAPSLIPRAGKSHGPLLLLWGGRDTHIPKEQHDAIEKALIETGKKYVNRVFPEALHGFFCDARASYNPDAAKEAWGLTLQFIKDTIG